MQSTDRPDWLARLRWVLLGVLLCRESMIRGDDLPPARPETWPDPAQIHAKPPSAAPLAELDDESGGEAASWEAGETPVGEPDGPLDPFFDLIDSSRLQRELDRAFGARFGRERQERKRPEVPEIGEPVFFDLTRPLGDHKYSNELNYLFNSSTRNGPTYQVIEYEYTFAEWNSAELDLNYFNGSLEVLTPFYQRTLGVGRRGRSVRGFQLSPDIYLRSGFIGGSAVLTYGWKPTKQSRFSTLTFVGVNRALIGGFVPTTTNRPSVATLIPAGAGRGAHSDDDRVYGSWRPTVNFNLFYKLSDKFALGIENDLFFQTGRASEYFSFPFVTWEAGQHAFFQVGGGYYHFEARDQFTFLLHLNFVNPSVRREAEVGKEEHQDESANEDVGAADDSPQGGRIRRWLIRRLGGV